MHRNSASCVDDRSRSCGSRSSWPLAASKVPLGAYEIVEQISRQRKRVSPISIYRVLEVLIEIGLVHRLATCSAYVVCNHAHASDETVVFLICQRCGGIGETTSHAVARSLDDVARTYGFEARARIIELEGECGDCRRITLKQEGTPRKSIFEPASGRDRGPEKTIEPAFPSQG